MTGTLAYATKEARDEYIENYVKPMLERMNEGYDILYFIVFEGTNNRILNSEKLPLVCSGDCIEDKLSFYESKTGVLLEKISVDEYNVLYGMI